MFENGIDKLILIIYNEDVFLNESMIEEET